MHPQTVHPHKVWGSSEGEAHRVQCKDLGNGWVGIREGKGTVLREKDGHPSCPGARWSL